MSCNSCQTKFSFFTRENGCPECGFSYCSKCLKYKFQLADKSVKICSPCHNKKMSDSDNGGNAFEMPSATKSLDATNVYQMQQWSQVPIKIYQPDHWDNMKAGLEPEDQALVDRLKKLKDEDKRPTPITTDEIRQRLARLRDEDSHHVPPSNTYKVDTRSDEEKTDALIQEYMEELDLSKYHLPTADDDIERRLNQLKGINPPKSSATRNIDETTVTKNIIARALAEAQQEKKFGNEQKKECKMEVEMPIQDDSDEELQCIICDSGNHLVQCLNCMGDIYCPSCFEEYHDVMEEHNTVPLKN